jgi:hypothetical protein
LAAAIVVAATTIVTVRFFVDPPLGAVQRPQAVVVLGGYGPRLQRGLAVARATHVHNLVVSIPPGPRTQTCPRTTAELHVTCFVPDPQSTQGEARTIGTVARHHGWRRLVIVAGTTQVVRARLRIDRCYDGEMAFSGVDPTGLFAWVREVVYDEVAMMKAVVWQWGC